MDVGNKKYLCTLKTILRIHRKYDRMKSKLCNRKLKKQDSQILLSINFRFAHFIDSVKMSPDVRNIFENF